MKAGECNATSYFEKATILTTGREYLGSDISFGPFSLLYELDETINSNMSGL